MDQKNLLVAIVLSIAVLFVFDFFVASPQREQLREQELATQQAQQPVDPSQPTAGDAPQAPGLSDGEALPGVLAGQERAAAVAGPRLQVETPTLRGSIALTGARIDDLILTQYRETLDENSPNIVLFSPLGAPDAYGADFGWVSSDQNIVLPRSDTVWQANEETLTPETPVTLSWDNGQGIRFEQTISVDDQYLFTVVQRVVNQSQESIDLIPYGRIARIGQPEILGFFILHEGLLGVFNGTLEEVDYDDVVDEPGGVIEQNTTGGWIGITDKYWMSALVPDQTSAVKGRFVFTPTSAGERYQSDFVYGVETLAPGGNIETTSRLFAGAKVVEVIDGYEEAYGIEGFDRAIDWGWLYFLTKPIFDALHWLHGIVGNFGVAILLLTVGIKLIFFPLANKSYKAMAKMRALQPKVMKLRERFGEDKQKLNQEMMALYKKEKVNPLAGCLPIIIQIPVFFALYKVLFVTIEMRHAPFFGWIQDLSAQDPTSILNLFGLLPYTVPDLGIFNIISLGIWPILMGLSMWFQQFLNPQPPDPIQARIFQLMPIMFTFLLASFPAGLVIYWTWNNTLSILQQVVIMKRQGVPIGRNPKPTTSGSQGSSSGSQSKT